MLRMFKNTDAQVIHTAPNWHKMLYYHEVIFAYTHLQKYLSDRHDLNCDDKFLLSKNSFQLLIKYVGFGPFRPALPYIMMITRQGIRATLLWCSGIRGLGSVNKCWDPDTKNEETEISDEEIELRNILKLRTSYSTGKPGNHSRHLQTQSTH